MNNNKVIFWPVIISIIGHVALISASSMIDLRDNVKAEDIFTIHINEPEQKLEKEEKKEVKNHPENKTNTEAKSIGNDTMREDTIDLGSSDTKYVSYLLKIKRKILQIWEYPQQAYEKNEEGIVVIRISLDSQGNLVATNLESSSGSALLDAGALSIVKAAAPFDQLPASYDLARLHIVASFRYKLVD
jgi:TonB family protein